MPLDDCHKGHILSYISYENMSSKLKLDITFCVNWLFQQCDYCYIKNERSRNNYFWYMNSLLLNLVYIPFHESLNGTGACDFVSS